MATTPMPINVFLAEDSPAIRNRIATLLGAGCISIVGQAATPAEAVAGILERRPHVVVLDVRLDGGSGMDVIRAVREAAPGIAFVVFSSNSGPVWRKRFLAEGASTFLDKATEFEQLAGAIVAAAGHPPPARSANTGVSS